MSDLVWLFTLDALDGAGAATTLRFADGQYVDGSDNLYRKRLKNPALIKVSPNDGGVFKIFSGASVGEVELDNTDGALNYIADYAIDGRAATLSLYNGTTTTTYFSGTCGASAREEGGSIFITLRTLKDLLDTDHPQAVYAGNNALPAGEEGVAGDLKGAVKPRCYGGVLNQTTKLVNTSLLIHQASARTSTVIAAVYDRGVALTQGADYANIAAMEATAPAAGQYRRYQGYFRLGSAPAGTITADSDDTSNLAGNVLSAICAERSVSVDSASITMLNSIGSVGLLIDSTTKTSDMINELIKGLGCYWYYIGSTIYASKIALASTSTFDLNYWHIEKIVRKGTGLGSNGLPVSSVKIQADKIETTQTDLNNTSVSATRVARLLAQYRKTEQNSSTTLTRHPLAPTINIDSCLRSITDADAVATSLLNVAKNRVDIIEINANFEALPVLSIGAGFTVYTDPVIDELSYSTGKLLTITGYELDVKYNSVKIEAIG